MWTTKVELRVVDDVLRPYVDESALASPGHLTLVFESEEVGRAILAAYEPEPDLF